MLSLRALAMIAVLVSAGCGHTGLRRGPLVLLDLACDQLVNEPTRDSTRTALAHGQVLPESSGIRRGSLLIHFLAYREGERLDPPFRVRIYRERGELAQAVHSETTSALVSDACGRALVEISCIRCTRPKFSDDIPEGRVDTLKVYLKRLRDNCELERAKKAAQP